MAQMTIIITGVSSSGEIKAVKETLCFDQNEQEIDLLNGMIQQLNLHGNGFQSILNVQFQKG